ncbi:hypothetical protein [Modestobacter sp. NPDC049651]|uniref:hypothetical protein n=1 Tax=unclassified Modestobacter TaxID=2643866 RepID=UPI0033DA8822
MITDLNIVPEPVPPIDQTPEVIAAEQLRQKYWQQVTAIRNRASSDPINSARLVVTGWQELNAALAIGLQEVLARRTARVQWLEGQVPWGPDVADDASDADRAVLLQAFRSVLSQARAATDKGLEQMLQDAAAFSDDVALRASLTALMERDGGREKARSWWLQVTGDTDLLDEAQRLSDEYVLWRMRVTQVFAPEPAPDELAALQAAQAAAEKAASDAQRARQMGNRLSGGMLG